MNVRHVLVITRLQSNQPREFLKIGNVRIVVKNAKRTELVPAGYATAETSAEVTAHLKWMVQKDMLKQDVFLIGPPGSLRSTIVLQYLELTNNEFEWLSLTRDSTEADIKQRREISAGNAFYSDLGAVRAAIHGRVLVIDGVEKAERNVLPILNNLLENREMQLDDGRFLMHHSKFDRLREKYSSTELHSMGLERVSEDFRVIALGLPVPKFPGFPLDPPLRSRFQSRNVSDMSYEACRLLCVSVAPRVPSDRLNSLISLVYALNGQTDLPFPYVPLSNLPRVAAIWNQVPSFPSQWAFRMLYPMEALLSDTEMRRVGEFVKKFDVQGATVHATVVSPSSAGRMKVSVKGKQEDLAVPSVSSAHPPPPSASSSSVPSFHATPAHSSLQVQLAASLAVGDVAFLGPKGAGKSSVVNSVATLMGYHPRELVLYQDMNSRELLQSRRMNEKGDTMWEDSELVRAAREGSLCVLDGVDRVHPSALTALAPLLHHRRIDLPDGSRLIGHDEWKKLLEKTKLSPEELVRRGVSEISPSFRVVLVGDVHSSINATKWMTSPIAALCPFIEMQPLTVTEKTSVILSVVPEANPKTVETVVRLTEKLATSKDASLQGVAPSLSLRRLIQVAKRDTLQPGTLRTLVDRATLSRFFPSLTKRSFDAALDEESIRDEHEPVYDVESEMSKVRIREGTLRVEDEAMIPDTLYYDNLQHNNVLVDMARDFRLGEHLLLIGNQGVGKNKITDRFLHLVKRPRHYMQLHRDTTVESLTLQTKVEGGVVRSEDSALVRAARSGHVLVIDEADKASVHVIAILKSLLDTGRLQLGDGRRIVPASEADPSNHTHIPLHPRFTAILLANRPGFPFLGNDLFGTIGDLCAVHVVENPSRESEMTMLKQYAPKVDDDTLLKLVNAFDELRRMADDGQIQYPYSTREIVSVAKHLNEFPADTLPEVVRNVFDFDGYSSERLETVHGVFRKHGIPIGVSRPSVRVSELLPIPAAVKIGEWSVQHSDRTLIPPTCNNIKLDWLDELTPVRHQLQHASARTELFTEEHKNWQMPQSETQIACDILALDDKSFIVAAVNPSMIFYVDDVNGGNVWSFDVYKHAMKASYTKEPVIRLGKLTDERVVLHDEQGSDMLVFDRRELALARLTQKTKGIMDTVAKLTQPLLSSNERWRLVPIPNSNRLAMFMMDSNRLDILEGENCIGLTLPQDVKGVIGLSGSRFILQHADGSESVLEEERHGWSLTPLHISLTEENGVRTAFQSTDGKRVVLDAHKCYYATVDEDTAKEQNALSIVASMRSSNDFARVDARRPYYASPTAMQAIDPTRNIVNLNDEVLVRISPRWETPAYAIHKDSSLFGVAGFLESVHIKSRQVSYVPVPEPRRFSYAPTWVSKYSPTPFILSPWDDSRVLTVDTYGTVRSFEAERGSLLESFGRWKDMVQGENNSADRIEFEKEDFDLSKLDTPKIGKFDPANTPHVGGNTWAGGTGGYNTAGLGGVGGPFRLDAGHDVHQMPEFAKAQVPEHILKKAREIAQAEYAKRLKEIRMSEHDGKAYDELWKRVEKNVKHVREIIDGLEAKKKERVWVRHQTTGDLDDAKLIEGVAGENNIYRRRAEKEPDPGTPQTKPKRLRVCMDLSGSMYRFNGYDKRLQRSLETALLVMTSLEGKQEKVKYELTGHSGDGPYHEFVVKDKYPTNDKERLDVLRQMLAHTQFCASGDFTLESLDDAKKTLAQDEDCDERIALLLSDANLERYGIRPKDLARIMNRDDGVKAYVVLIGSLGDQAETVQKELPAGRSFVCRDTDELPKIIQEIFDATIV